MSNNNNSGKGKDTDIITKKGFLISLPGKKKDVPEGTSSINMAKPHNQNQNQSQKKDNAKPENNDKNNSGNKYNKFDKNKKRHGDKNKKGSNTQENKAQSQDNRQKDNNKPVNSNNDRHQNNNPSRNEEQKHDKKSDRGRRNDKRNRHGNHNDRHNQQNRDNRHEKQEKDIQTAKSDNGKIKSNLLSSLSSDMAGQIKTQNPKKQSEPLVNELSLEEKYKNAKPLAEQIAEQEMRQKGIKIPYDNQAKQENDEKQEIVGIRFREAGKIYYFDPAGMKVPFGAPVIVETARGSEYGFCAISNRMIPVSSLTAPLKKIERLATVTDTQKHEANKDLEKDAEKVFLEKVEKLGLPMNLIYVEYTFDNSRLLFYFTAETRIDFRELVKELAGVFRTRIELRQIGVRDEAKMLGGLGVCGRATCCNTFLGDFAQVSIKMAKDQSLSLNAAKISGACGKLMCCLRYEDKVYEEENARTPKVGSIVETAEGKGVVVERNALKGIVNVQLENTPEAPAKPFPREEVMVVGFNKDKDEDDIDAEELKHLQDS